jgi:hypothetical protein
MVLVAVQEVLSESKEKSQSAQRWPRRRMGRRSSGGAVAEGRWCFKVWLLSSEVRDRFLGDKCRI